MDSQRRFVLVAFHCSDGHGDTLNILGIFAKLFVAIDMIQIQQQCQYQYQMDSVDHGFFLFAVDLGQPYLPSFSKVSPNCIYCVRYQISRGQRSPNPKWKEQWFNQNYYNAMLKIGYAREGSLCI